MEPAGSLPHSQQPASCPYADPDRSSPCSHPASWRSILILSPHLRLGLSSGLFPSLRFPHQKPLSTSYRICSKLTASRAANCYDKHCNIFRMLLPKASRSQWRKGLKRGSAAARLLQLRVWIPPGAWMSVSCECCVLSGRGLCVGPIPRLEEYYRLCYVIVCDIRTSNYEAALARVGLLRQTTKQVLK